MENQFPLIFPKVFWLVGWFGFLVFIFFISMMMLSFEVGSCMDVSAWQVLWPPHSKSGCH